MNEAEEVDGQIDPQDLEITVSRCERNGAGRGGVSHTTDSLFADLHRQTGTDRELCRRTPQMKNQAKPMTVLRSD